MPPRDFAYGRNPCGGNKNTLIHLSFPELMYLLLLSCGVYPGYIPGYIQVKMSVDLLTSRAFERVAKRDR